MNFPIHLRLLAVMIMINGLTPAGMAGEEAAALRERAREFLAPLPEQMPGSEQDTRALVRLGRKLYFDKRLSVDGETSCHSCHSLFAQPRPYAPPVAPGSRNPPGARNPPTVLNAGLHVAQFWDGRAPDLEAQAREPMLNPDEMGMPGEEELIEKLQSMPLYRWRFRRAFPGVQDPISLDRVARAIAAYERTLITRDRFDDFLRGRDSALSEAERQGLTTFLNFGCQKCHDGPALGGNSFRQLGIHQSYSDTNDLGRAGITGRELDRFNFKVPALRNVALTAPYFHDGKVETLPEAVEQMALLQLGVSLSEQEIESIVAFLGSLSDKHLDRKQVTVPPRLLLN